MAALSTMGFVYCVAPLLQSLFQATVYPAASESVRELSQLSVKIDSSGA